MSHSQHIFKQKGQRNILRALSQLDGDLTVVSFFRFVSSLFVAEDEVDPVVKILRHVFALQSGSRFADEICAVWKTQRRQSIPKLTVPPKR